MVAVYILVLLCRAPDEEQYLTCAGVLWPVKSAL